MSERIITLFGEEIVPEQLKAVGRSRAKKKQEDKNEDGAENNEPELKNESSTGEAAPATEIINKAQQASNEPAIAGNTEEISNTASTENGEETTAAITAEEINNEPANEAQSEDKNEDKKSDKIVAANLPEDWQGSKQYYSIGEVAELFKVKTSHIRFWTNEFKLKVRTTRKGDRLYTPEQIKELRAINHLVKERGFTLKGAKTRLKAPEKMEVETVDLKQSLLQLRNKLVAIKNQLK